MFQVFSGFGEGFRLILSGWRCHIRLESLFLGILEGVWGIPQAL